jgi:hypothetical protein
VTTSDVTFRIEVEGAQAKRELEAIGKSADTMAGRLDKVSASVKGVAGKIDSSFGSIERVMRQVGVQSNATGKMMLEVVGSAGDIAQAFAMGGPLLGGLAAGTAAVAALTKHWTELNAAQMAAIDAQFAATDDAAAILNRARGANASLREEIATGGMSEQQKAYRAVQNEIDTVTAKLNGMRQAGKFWTQNEIDAAKMLRTAIEELEKKQNLAVAAANMKGKGAKVGSVVGAVADVVTGDSDRTDSDSLEAQLARIDDANTARETALAEARDRELEIERQYGLAVVEEQKKINRLMEEQYKADLSTRTALASEALGIGVSSAQGLVDALITGQENALEHFAAQVSRQAGSAMIGHGINAAAGGIAMLSLGNPAGAAALGTGAALIGGGLALGGVGTGIEHMLAGGQIGQALPKKPAASDRGVNSGRGRGGGGSGVGAGVTYQFNYGVAGPQPDETAREIARQNRRARSRGFADETITVSR